MKKYDIVILGGGPGGYVAAIKASQLGAKTAIIEKNALGGVCLNWGCIPTKTLLKSAKVYHYIKNSSFFGIDIDDDNKIYVNWPNMIKRKNTVVKKLTGGVKVLLDKNGVDTFIGEGKVIDKNTIQVNKDKISTNNLIIATGSKPFIPPIKGIDKAKESKYVLTSKDILDLKELPKKLVIVGGGVIGVEFASLFSELNCEVTILEKAPNILLSVDSDIRKVMLRKLKKLGIKIRTEADVVEIGEDSVSYKLKNKIEKINSDKVLISIGTRPNIESIKTLGLELDKSAIKTNEKLETSVNGVYAIGDVNGKYMLAHVASHEGIVAVENILGKNSKIDYEKIPSAIYTSPEIAFVGISEDEAKARGLDVKVGQFPLGANGKALAEAESDGIIKVIADRKYGEILGVHILSPNATDMIAELVVTMNLEGTIHDVANSIHPHPTFSEAIMEANLSTIDKAIHALK